MYKPEWINPVSTNYRGYDVWELPPNGQGYSGSSDVKYFRKL